MSQTIDSIVSLATTLGPILGFMFYGAIVLWTYKDARRRIDDPILVATAVALSMLPIVGVFVYMLLRPPEYLADVRERALEILAMERTLGSVERCPKCKSFIESDYRSCPECATKLRQACVDCSRPLDPRWKLCPFCEAPVGGYVRGSSRSSYDLSAELEELTRPVRGSEAPPRRQGSSDPNPARSPKRPPTRPVNDSPKDAPPEKDAPKARSSAPAVTGTIWTEPMARPMRRADQPTMITPGPGELR